MKKENYLSVSFIAFLCVIFVSCQKETMFLTSNPNASVSTEVIGVNSTMGIVDSLINISVNLDEELSRGTTEDQLYTSIAKEQEIAKNQDIPGGGSNGGKDGNESKGAEMAKKYNQRYVIEQ